MARNQDSFFFFFWEIKTNYKILLGVPYISFLGSNLTKDIKDLIFDVIFIFLKEIEYN